MRFKPEKAALGHYKDLPVTRASVVPVTALALIVWTILGPVVSIVGVPVLGVILIKGKSCGLTVLTSLLLTLLVPLLAPLLYLYMFFYLLSFCGWVPFLERKVSKNST